jgi:putative pectin methyltransferase
MMVEEEHISFHSDSLMVDGVEDYSHQIAEMIGLRNESNFNEAGVSKIISLTYYTHCSLTSLQIL